MSTNKTSPVRVNTELLERARKLSQQFKRPFPIQWMIEMAIDDFCTKAEKEGGIEMMKNPRPLSSSAPATAPVAGSGARKCHVNDAKHCEQKRKSS